MGIDGKNVIVGDRALSYIKNEPNKWSNICNSNFTDLFFWSKPLS